VHRASFDNLDVRKGRSTLRCIGSTATLQSQKRDEDTNRGFNLVTLKRKENQVTSIEARSFGWTANGFSLEASRSFEHNAGALRELSS